VNGARGHVSVISERCSKDQLLHLDLKRPTGSEFCAHDPKSGMGDRKRPGVSDLPFHMRRKPG